MFGNSRKLSVHGPQILDLSKLMPHIFFIAAGYVSSGNYSRPG
jgi:hypothetical protein